MAEDIKAMSDELARHPDSMVFLRLGEALRVDGRVDAANRIASMGVDRHPDSAAARCLHARVLLDKGEVEAARTRWREALLAEPRNMEARKGLGFIAYREGDLDGALDHLEIALSVDPTDPTVVQGIRRVRERLEMPEGGVSGFDFGGLASDDQQILLVDRQGLVLGGSLEASGADVSIEGAALLTGVVQEAERTGRILGLGNWITIVAESTAGNLHIARPDEDVTLMLVRDRSIPSGRMGWIADKAVRAAREWLAEEAG